MGSTKIATKGKSGANPTVEQLTQGMITIGSGSFVEGTFSSTMNMTSFFTSGPKPALRGNIAVRALTLPEALKIVPEIFLLHKSRRLRTLRANDRVVLMNGSGPSQRWIVHRNDWDRIVEILSFEPVTALSFRDASLLAPYIKKVFQPTVPTFSPYQAFIKATSPVAFYQMRTAVHGSQGQVLWQTEDTSMPVTEIGQPIGRVDDLTGNKPPMIQTDSSFRPQWVGDRGQFDEDGLFYSGDPDDWGFLIRTNEFTITSRVRVVDITINRAIFSARVSTSDTNGPVVLTRSSTNGGLRWVLSIDGTSSSQDAGMGSASELINVTFVRDDLRLFGYIDDVEVISWEHGLGVSTSPLGALLRWSRGPGDFAWQALIGQSEYLAVWDRALSPAEVSQLPT